MNKNKKRQNGITIVSLLIMVAIALFVVTNAIKIAPIYIENFNVEHSLETIANEINENKIAPKDFKSKLITRLKNNNVTRITEDHINISGGVNNTDTINIEYEVRKPFMGNIEFVMSFQNSQEINL